MNELDKRKAPDFVKCTECGGSNILMTDVTVFCNDCEVGLPWALSLCPKCCSFKAGAKSVQQAKKPGRAPIVMQTCGDCGERYNSNSCLRVPYSWFWGMVDMRKREQCGKDLQYGSLKSIEPPQR